MGGGEGCEREGSRGVGEEGSSTSFAVWVGWGEGRSTSLAASTALQSNGSGGARGGAPHKRPLSTALHREGRVPGGGEKRCRMGRWG